MDGYEKVKVLGAGSFGEAALVKHLASGKLCVAKRVAVAPAELADAAREASVLASLSRPRRHPNVVAYFSSWSEVGPPAALTIVMEYAAGVTSACLGSALKR